MVKKQLWGWASILLVATGSAAVPTTKIIERIIARVNNNIITQRQFEEQKQKLRGELAQQYAGDELEKQYRLQSQNLLRDMIDEDLLVQKAKDDDLNADTDVVKQLDQIRQNMHLATIQDLEKEVENQGMIWEDFQEKIRRRILMQKAIEREVGSRLQITQQEAREYFKNHQQEFVHPAGVHLAELLVSTEKYKPAEAEARANQALSEIKAGQRWEDVVKKYSDAENTGPGGDIGFMETGTMAPGIANALAKLDVGENTDVIPTRYGYMILKVLGRRSPGTPKFEEVEQQVDEVLYNQKMQKALRSYLTELRKQSYIYIAPGYMDSGAAAPNPADQTVTDTTAE